MHTDDTREAERAATEYLGRWKEALDSNPLVQAIRSAYRHGWLQGRSRAAQGAAAAVQFVSVAELRARVEALEAAVVKLTEIPAAGMTAAAAPDDSVCDELPAAEDPLQDLRNRIAEELGAEKVAVKVLAKKLKTEAEEIVKALRHPWFVRVAGRGPLRYRLAVSGEGDAGN